MEKASAPTAERIAASKQNLRGITSDANLAAFLLHNCDEGQQKEIRDLCKPDTPSLGDLEAFLDPDAFAEALNQAEVSLQPLQESYKCSSGWGFQKMPSSLTFSKKMSSVDIAEKLDFSLKALQHMAALKEKGIPEGISSPIFY